jgi:hypothetical protein
MRRALTVVLPCFLLAAMIVGHTVAWYAASRYLAVGFDTWVAQRRAAGWQVDAGVPARGGWPMAATLTVPDLALSAGPAGGPGRISWHAAQVTLSLAVTSPDRLGIDLAGAQSLRVAPWPELPFTADRLRVEVPLTRAMSTPSAGLDIRSLRGPGLAIGLVTGQVVAAAAPTLTISAEAIDLPSDIRWAFGPHISSLAVDATLQGGLPPAGALPAMAEAWRGAGGALEVTHFALGWGPLGVAAKGRAEFDDHLQPAGTVDLHVIGFAKALEALAAQHLITRDAAMAATAVLTLLSHVPQDGGNPEVEVPLEVRGGKLLMGRTPLLRVPELVWPTP